MQLRKILNTLLFALIAMCLVFSLVGCGDKAGGGDSEENKIPDVTPGTMSEINPALVNAVDLSKSLGILTVTVILLILKIKKKKPRDFFKDIRGKKTWSYLRHLGVRVGLSNYSFDLIILNHCVIHV